jgi:AraC-like DNA-binding protein
LRAAVGGAFQGSFDGVEVERLIGQAIAGLGAAGVLAPIDRRIVRALDLLVHEADGAVARGELARRVGLSPGRLTHLFQEETGTSLRSYQLWLRGRDALRRFGATSSLTEVAHAAGFADAAHLSRTAKRMLGVTASHLRHHATFDRYCGPTSGAGGPPSTTLPRAPTIAPIQSRRGTVSPAGSFWRT